MRLLARHNRENDIDLRERSRPEIVDEDLVDDDTAVRAHATETHPSTRAIVADEEVTTERDATRDVVTVERTRLVAPGLLVAMLIGAGLVVLGAVTALRGGLGGDLYLPEIEVAGLSRTPAVGLLEMGVGTILVVTALLRFSLVAMTLAVSMAIAGGIVAAAPEELPSRLALERPYGWVLVGAGVLILLAGTILPTTTTQRVEQIPQAA